MLITDPATGEPLARLLVFDPSGLDFVATAGRADSGPGGIIGIQAWTRDGEDRLALIIEPATTEPDIAGLPLSRRLELLRSGQGLVASPATPLRLSATVTTAEWMGLHRRHGADGQVVLDSPVRFRPPVTEEAADGSWSPRASMADRLAEELRLQPGEVAELKLTHLAVSITNGQVWLGAHAQLGITNEALLERLGPARADGFAWTTPARGRLMPTGWDQRGWVDLRLLDHSRLQGGYRR